MALVLTEYLPSMPSLGFGTASGRNSSGKIIEIDIVLILEKFLKIVKTVFTVYSEWFDAYDSHRLPPTNTTIYSYIRVW